ncbi:exonuclease SbcC [Amycolatopsis pretoriensis]|uniref:Nuclease SbcCD subunit C n=1 Tax=Amycolatopsis pretoriensis TaxID=218821 RepID=A0A1H5RLK9_9PSEU|nr:SMC family ATPase [Amycolatopsis pretoriensis]SEF38407.1 exonuclease SbcC [Amycolatopsis pretoriensis]
MRPLTLRFGGLRSYRAEQEIDFTDVTLMAIVGDTGAGKSSILEALSFALYGGCTWDNRSSKGLIADGGDGTARAELTFQARNKVWKVTRTTSAGGSPPSVHRLEGVTDGSLVEGSRAVGDAVQKLVGLDHQAFLKAVVLPQGRFQELLQAKDTDRTAILKNVLGLDQLAEVRQQAVTTRERLEPLLQDLKHRRGLLLDDPANSIVDAEARRSAAAQQVTALEQLQRTVREARTAGDNAARKAKEHRTAASRLMNRLPDDIERRYHDLAGLDSRLTDETATVGKQLEDADDDAERLNATLTAADLAGTGIAGVTEALTTFKLLPNQLAELETQRRDIEEEKSAIGVEQAALVDRERDHVLLVTKAEDSEAEVEKAKTVHTNAVSELERCRTLLADARQAARTAKTSAASVGEIQKDLNDRKTDFNDASLAFSHADDAVKEARKYLEAMRRANSAAHAAAVSKAGEPCPICVRPLPGDFVAPATAETTQAARNLTKAEKRAGTAHTALTRAEVANETVRNRFEEAVKAAKTANSERDETYSAAAAALGDFLLEQDEESILAEVRSGAEQTAVTLEQVEAEAKAAHDAMTEGKARLRHDKEALAKRSENLVKLTLALERRRGQVLATYEVVPDQYRLHAEPTAEAIERGTKKAQQRLDELNSIKAKLDGVQKVIKSLRRQSKKLAEDRRASVELPVAELGRLVQSIADRTIGPAEMTGLAAAAQRPTPLSITTDARWALDVLGTVEGLVQRCLREAQVLEQNASTARNDADAKLAGVGITDESELEHRLTDTRTDVRQAQRDRAEAVAQEPICAELDARISATQPVVQSLRELAGLLADGKFPAAVVKRRQRALLGLASERLRSVTKERFAFSNDFRIVDGHTGQPRDVRTLSGGETFLASLALALALVELTSRGGGRVEALFLDEGFGSLDSNVLSEALEALTRQARDGRLVTVISHMRDVAENFDNVLLVTKKPGGSRAHWLSADERDQLITDEMTAGLLT